MSTNIVVPELGESVVEARVAKWLKKAGDRVAAGDALVELETEKIDLEVSADRAGTLTVIKHQAGADVKVGEVLAVLEEGSDARVPEVRTVPQVPKGEVPMVPGVPTVPGALPADTKATPTAKNVAKAHDVKLDSVAASGPRVTKQDVLRAAPQAPQAPYAPQAPEVGPPAPILPLPSQPRKNANALRCCRSCVAPATR
jgi:2-oxoglutarate dehydrogenase E2 component (dihydrolipoamide succinyltransferase)